MTRDPKVFEYLLSHKRCKVSVDLLTRALIEGETSIACIMLTHPRFKEILKAKPRASIDICEEESPSMDFDEMDEFVKSKEERKVVEDSID
jgi:hypothetical protein